MGAATVGAPGSPPSRASQVQDYDPESPSLGKRPGAWPSRMDPVPTDHSHNPKLLGSWARRTGFKSNISGESVGTGSDAEINKTDAPNPPLPKPPSYFDPSKAKIPQNGNLLPNGHKDPEKPKLLGIKTEVVSSPVAPIPVPTVKKGTESENVSGVQSSGPFSIEPLRQYKDSEADMMSHSEDGDDVLLAKQSHIKYEIRETPGIFPLIFYGLQHYFSIAGSLILLPLVFVPAMGGSDEDTARVVSTMLLVSGITTLLHSFFGSRLPLIQGASFVYLAPVLTIIFSPDFAAVSDNRFKHIMKELQGAVIISSIFQVLVGYSGLMSILVRLINPVVVAPTVAAVGLAFFSYGFPVVGSCVEIGIPQILILLFFALYLRKISIFGHRIFQVYAVPLGLGIIWAYAFLLTETGTYNYKGCDMHIPISNIVSHECQRHVYTMQHCRTDVSKALRKAAWFRFPYPFQWGAPTFHLKTGVVMIAASIIASIDSVGTYHATSLLVASRAPPPGVVSRGIGLEGITSALAGIWGTGTGATTLTENVHTIAVTKMGSRRAVEFGACVLIVLSIIGKVGGFIASIPQVIVAGLLCFMWTMLAALGLSNLRYSETGSSRNVLIVGLSLFLSLSIPAYFQQYNAHGSVGTISPIEPYFQPYAVSQHGPIRTKSHAFNFALNSILSLHMVIAFLVAFILDNTVPGSRQERGLYVWSRPRTARQEPALVKDYGLPFGLARFFAWMKWVGL
ncbi:hypothetical protein O6H91_15G057500 [Diphasiastrum complanatum]|uniref:Uncharacterized protein n=13 Tax=Diphasiastrum complanatum TaxID=34168 RepID=A0ACC2BIJ7_DIPCM|nr:hypothetical protein O6H91_15G057500 [Diphasiastrum complanatum]KAJ7529576.1 hypothetical protein O6H91_15G057500 [Diphasiastrum complanatum]KAJ7529577.1 hypothetical protein O6H91_15G057500 [Diphasiastrum complanatum]KAJ7529578.1 hypothetical protein O6H91_15G057500 [Diphasiastrum complanatum]KAJ7529579.1 hypothetical protein O6H91_15G057500 [Diphasiastrum complanatum]